MGGGADEAACVAEHQGVAAIEDGQRRERVEAGVKGAKVGGGGVELALDGMAETGAAGQQAFAGLGNGLAGIAAQDAGGEGGNV